MTGSRFWVDFISESLLSYAGFLHFDILPQYHYTLKDCSGSCSDTNPSEQNDILRTVFHCSPRDGFSRSHIDCVESFAVQGGIMSIDNQCTYFQLPWSQSLANLPVHEYSGTHFDAFVFQAEDHHMNDFGIVGRALKLRTIDHNMCALEGLIYFSA